MKASIGIPAKQTEAICNDILSPLLANEFLLYLKTRKAHWNIEGPDFHAVHIYFEELYTQLETVVDLVAERIRKIGHYTPATMKQYLSLTHLKELTKETTSGKNDSLSYMKDLLADHESIIKFLRDSVEKIENDYEEDFGTGDFLTSLLEKHETAAWMLRSHLK